MNLTSFIYSKLKKALILQDASLTGFCGKQGESKDKKRELK